MLKDKVAAYTLFQEARKLVKDTIVELLGTNPLRVLELEKRLKTRHPVQFFKMKNGVLMCDSTHYKGQFEKYDDYLIDEDIIEIAERLYREEYGVFNDLKKGEERYPLYLYTDPNGNEYTKLHTYKTKDFEWDDMTYFEVRDRLNELILKKGKLRNDKFVVILEEPISLTLRTHYYIRKYENIREFETCKNGWNFYIPQIKHNLGGIKCADVMALLKRLEKL